MERMFLTRASAIERIMLRRRSLLDTLNARDASGADTLNAELTELERLLLDVRAGRAHEFVLQGDAPLHCFVTIE
ncbi:MAG TPA: hypothetical protein VNE00_11170 [Paraburkholderia sp.]|jgi:hypothetical protein|nr:hypothetical protein [Paraburkholderia sp.]